MSAVGVHPPSSQAWAAADHPHDGVQAAERKGGQDHQADGLADQNRPQPQRGETKRMATSRRRGHNIIASCRADSGPLQISHAEYPGLGKCLRPGL